MIISVLYPMPMAFAQGGVRALEEVVVTARKREESAQEVPIAISSFSGDDLKQQGATTFEDITFHVPNMVTTTSPGNGGSPRFAIRGQTVGDVVGTVDQAIGVYFDDVFYARPAGTNMTLSDIDHVEVLRGPQGTLFGRNTTGGAILVHTKDPENELAYRVGAGFGNYNQISSNVMLNSPIIDNVLAFRIVLDSSKHDGYTDNPITGADVHDEDTVTGQLKVLYTPTDAFRALLKFAYAESDHRGFEQKLVGFRSNGALYAPYLDDNAEKTYESEVPITQARASTSSLILDWDLDSFAVKFIGAYRKTDTRGFWDLDGSPFKIASTDGQQLGGDQWSGELQFTGEAFDDRMNWIVGLYSFYEDGTDLNITNLAPAAVSPGVYLLQNNTDGDYQNDSQAVFGQSTYQFTDDLSFTLGLRYSQENKKLASHNYRVFSLGPPAIPVAPSLATSFPVCALSTGVRPDPTVCTAKFDRTDYAFNYTAMLEYKLNYDTMVYGKVGTGFRSGGHNIRGTDALSFEQVEPEEVKEYEIGIKGDYLDHRLRVNLAAFHSKYEDIQRSNIVPTADGRATQNVTRNAAAATIEGVELDITAALTNEWQVGMSAGYTDAAYDEFLDTQPVVGSVPPQTVVVDRTSESFVGTPEWTAGAWTSYTLESAWGPVTGRLDYAWHDSYQSFLSTDTLAMITPAKGELNARIVLSTWGERLDVALWGKNLTDERYKTAAINFYGNWGAGVAVFNDPRTFGLDVTYHYGE